jgi:ribosome-associated protein
MLRSLIKAANEASIQNRDHKGRVLGSPENGWIAVDYGDVVLHIFSPNQRDYYRLEDLWAEGKIVLKIK